MKSKLVTYLLWSVGGVFGLHHLYLHRYTHAFLWFATCGGFGFGCFRETWRISHYVDEYNLRERKALKFYGVKSPPFSALRFCGEFATGVLFGTLLHGAIPKEAYSLFPALNLIGCVGTLLGVYLVANIGDQCCHIKYLFASVLLAISYCLLSGFQSDQMISTAAFFASVTACWKCEWKPIQPTKSSCFKVLAYVLCVVLYVSLWGSVLLNSVTITTRHGEDIKLKDAMRNFFNSPAWEETKKTMKELYDELYEEGFYHAWRELMVAFDPEGEDHAHKVLGIEYGASEQEIKSAYKHLAKTWHPDRHKDPVMKSKASKKFQEINQAYETLSSIKMKRASTNRRSRNEL